MTSTTSLTVTKPTTDSRGWMCFVPPSVQHRACSRPPLASCCRGCSAHSYRSKPRGLTAVGERHGRQLLPEPRPVQHLPSVPSARAYVGRSSCCSFVTGLSLSHTKVSRFPRAEGPAPYHLSVTYVCNLAHTYQAILNPPMHPQKCKGGRFISFARECPRVQDSKPCPVFNAMASAHFFLCPRAAHSTCNYKKKPNICTTMCIWLRRF